MRWILVFCFILLAPAVAHPVAFYEDKDRGWFFYEPEPEVVEEEPEDQPKPAPAPTPPPVPAVQAPAPPPPLSVEWFEQNLDHYRNLAIDEPTSQNVRNYLYLQKVMFQKGENFAKATAVEVMKDAFLDEGTRRPLASFGSRAMELQAEARRNELLKRIASTSGIYFFHDGGVASQTQAGPLKRFSDTHGIKVMPISVDGHPLQQSPFGPSTMDHGQARLLGINTLPALFLVDVESKTVGVISYSVSAWTELESRLLLAALNIGIITEEEYNSTIAIDRSRDIDMDKVALDVFDSANIPSSISNARK